MRTSDKYAIIFEMARKYEKKSKTPPKKKKQRKKVQASEIVGVLTVLSAVFLLISLGSYHSHDPSWAAVSSFDQKIHNYGGRVGASLAEALLQLLGFVSFVVPLGMIYLGIQPFRPREERRFFLKAAGLIILLLLLSSLLYLILNSVTWREAEIFSGGLAGSLFASFFIRYFNHTGSILIITGALFLFVVFSTRISIGKIVAFLYHIFQFAFKEMRIRITHYRKEKKKQKMRQKVIAKYAPSEAKPKKEKDIRILTKSKGRKPPDETEKKPAPETPQPAPEKEEFLFPELKTEGGYQFPPYNLLDPAEESEKIDKKELFEKKEAIEQKLMEFRVQGEVREYHPGPIVTTYEYYPHAGIKVSQVANLSEELSLALQAESVRIQRIPGKSSVGIEAPNNRREIIRARDIIQSDKFQKSPSKLTIALGKTIHGEVYVTDLAVMPHLLIGGATGTGKSVALNTIITSLLYKASPDEVKIILVDPKRLEFSLYDGMPHLMCPVVKDPKKAGSILVDAINKMDERYHILGSQKVRNIEQYNLRIKRILQERKGKLTPEEKEELKPLPYIVIIIDELAELMMIGAEEVEKCIARLAQLARAVGIHLIMATQRPSIDVITGTIKNNFSCRIAFRVPTKIDSRIIIDSPGAEKLLGKGDLLFMPPNYPRLMRLHCSYVSLAEVTRLTKFVKDQAKPSYDEDIIKVLKSPEGHAEQASEDKDALFEKAVELVLLTGQASASYLQRKLKLGYARAARIIDQMEMEGIVGPSEGSKPREILIDPQSYLDKISHSD